MFSDGGERFACAGLGGCKRLWGLHMLQLLDYVSKTNRCTGAHCKRHTTLPNDLCNLLNCNLPLVLVLMPGVPLKEARSTDILWYPCRTYAVQRSTGPIDPSETATSTAESTRQTENGPRSPIAKTTGDQAGAGAHKARSDESACHDTKPARTYSHDKLSDGRCEFRSAAPSHGPGKCGVINFCQCVITSSSA